MIKIEHITTNGVFLYHAIMGMRNSYNSWDDSDSDVGEISGDVFVGEEDLTLMQRLYRAGASHRKFMRQIPVTMDVTAPMYWWKQAETYKIGTTMNSCSTMHSLMNKEFELSDFSTDILNTDGSGVLEYVIGFMNQERGYYSNGIHGELIKDRSFKDNVIGIMPMAYNQRRTWSFNYEVAANMIEQRRDHDLNEWKVFTSELLLRLPYLKEIMDIEGR